MSLLTRILGADEIVAPYDAEIVYVDGSTAAVHVFAKDMRDALLSARFWMPLHMPATRVVITERVKA
jgi:hypothetical protein